MSDPRLAAFHDDHTDRASALEAFRQFGYEGTVARRTDSGWHASALKNGVITEADGATAREAADNAMVKATELAAGVVSEEQMHDAAEKAMEEMA